MKRAVAVKISHPAKGRAEFDALVVAMDRARPRCRDFEFFVADNPDDAQTAFAKRLCSSCPIRSACRTYAEAASPLAGIWAGRIYPLPKEKPIE